MLTLRQIEVIRAIMVTGTVAGAARLLNVSAPGLSRLMKHTETSLGVRLFDRRNGRFVPTAQANGIFEQVNTIFTKVEDLRGAISRLETGASQELRIGSVPSIANVMVPRAIETVRRHHPDLVIDINTLKIEEAIDYLLLGKGEVVAISSRFDHPSLTFEPLASGELFCIVPEGHPLDGFDVISAEEIVRHPLIGIDPNDPYGRIMSNIFRERGLPYEITIRARFGTTVCALVKAGLGIAIIDQFTVAHGAVPGLKLLRIREPTRFDTYVASKAGTMLSSFAETFVKALRTEMKAAVLNPEPLRGEAAVKRISS
ncbi:LysR family transcriptional regulator [Microvirga aerophila]|uniref:Transcriptional regulator n=1 Tax=Microvirga aerophila TaxID=670291 RepID=A0A512BYK7_9HYPH|nr:LysR family transcriptional regulator [Microvirga aerophila]GEO16927.1 transcriptional regulator [Microvirga aerophila]